MGYVLVEKLLPFLDRFFGICLDHYGYWCCYSRFFLRILFPIRLYIIPPIKKLVKRIFLTNLINFIGMVLGNIIFLFMIHICG